MNGWYFAWPPLRGLFPPPVPLLPSCHSLRLPKQRASVATGGEEVGARGGAGGEGVWEGVLRIGRWLLTIRNVAWALHQATQAPQVLHSIQPTRAARFGAKTMDHPPPVVCWPILEPYSEVVAPRPLMLLYASLWLPDLRQRTGNHPIGPMLGPMGTGAIQLVILCLSSRYCQICFHTQSSILVFLLNKACSVDI